MAIFAASLLGANISLNSGEISYFNANGSVQELLYNLCGTDQFLASGKYTNSFLRKALDNHKIPGLKAYISIHKSNVKFTLL